MSGIMLNVVGGTFGNPAPSGIGAAFGGGYYAGSISTAGNDVADFYLVVGPMSSAKSNKQWKTSNTGGDPTSVIDGPTNSSTMNSAVYPAAEFCEGLTVGGFSDWYMPARNELEVCYYNLKPTTDINVTGSGTNANAVPSRGNYSTGDPAQTSAADFKDTGTEDFTANTYWSSTQNPSYSSYGRTQSFSSGQQSNAAKTANYNVRAIRRVAV